MTQGRQHTPNVLLIGAGRFGKQYIRILTRLENEGELHFAGIVVGTEESKKLLSEVTSVSILVGFSHESLLGIDAVCIATPPESHAAIAAQCLPYAHVFAEKPLALTEEECLSLGFLATEYDHILMVGHIFRYTPLVAIAQSYFMDRELPMGVSGVFVNPTSAYTGRDPAFELLHYFDIMDVLFGKLPEVEGVSGGGAMMTAQLSYPDNVNAKFILGWRGEERVRWLEFFLPVGSLRLDFNDESYELPGGAGKRYVSKQDREPLEQELRDFLRVIAGEQLEYVDAQKASRIIRIAKACSLQQNNIFE